MDLKYLAVLIFNQGVRCDGHFFKMYIILQHPYTQSPSAPAVLHRPLLKSKIPN